MQGTAARNDFALNACRQGARLTGKQSGWGESHAITRRSVCRHSGAVLASLACPGFAFAEAFPSKTIKIIAVPAGGPADSAVRIPQLGMDKLLGQSIIIENVSGVFTRVIRERNLKFDS